MIWWLVCAISLFRLFAWRYFVLAPRHNARRKDETKQKRNNEMAQTSHHTLMLIYVFISESGTIDFDEFEKIFSSKLTVDPEQELHEVFCIFDSNLDGFISDEELFTVLQKLGEHTSMVCSPCQFYGALAHARMHAKKNNNKATIKRTLTKLRVKMTRKLHSHTTVRTQLKQSNQLMVCSPCQFYGTHTHARMQRKTTTKQQ